MIKKRTRCKDCPNSDKAGFDLIELARKLACCFETERERKRERALVTRMSEDDFSASINWGSIVDNVPREFVSRNDGGAILPYKRIVSV